MKRPKINKKRPGLAHLKKITTLLVSASLVLVLARQFYLYKIIHDT